MVLKSAMSEVSDGNWRMHYQAGVEQIAADCRAGLDVAFITEGDPPIYSTAACVWQLLEELAPEIGVEIAHSLFSTRNTIGK